MESSTKQEPQLRLKRTGSHLQADLGVIFPAQHSRLRALGLHGLHLEGRTCLPVSSAQGHRAQREQLPELTDQLGERTVAFGPAWRIPMVINLAARAREFETWIAGSASLTTPKRW